MFFQLHSFSIRVFSYFGEYQDVDKIQETFQHIEYFHRYIHDAFVISPCIQAKWNFTSFLLLTFIINPVTIFSDNITIRKFVATKLLLFIVKLGYSSLKG